MEMVAYYTNGGTDVGWRQNYLWKLFKDSMRAKTIDSRNHGIYNTDARGNVLVKAISTCESVAPEELSEWINSSKWREWSKEETQ